MDPGTDLVDGPVKFRLRPADKDSVTTLRARVRPAS
jgi:hypothetical protein